MPSWLCAAWHRIQRGRDATRPSLLATELEFGISREEGGQGMCVTSCKPSLRATKASSHAPSCSYSSPLLSRHARYCQVTCHCPGAEPPACGRLRCCACAQPLICADGGMPCMSSLPLAYACIITQHRQGLNVGVSAGAMLPSTMRMLSAACAFSSALPQGHARSASQNSPGALSPDGLE